MLRQWLFRLTLVSWFVTAGALSAQNAQEHSNSIGLVLGLYGPGLYLPMSKAVAVRFDVGGSVLSADDFDSGSVGLGMSALRYLSDVDELRTYVGARIGYAFTWSTGNAAHTKVPNGSLLFGTEYAIRPRLGLFGEAVGSYSRSTGTRVGVNNTAITFASSATWSIGSGIGLLFHF